jgi:hypothetical protein
VLAMPPRSLPALTELARCAVSKGVLRCAGEPAQARNHQPRMRSVATLRGTGTGIIDYARAVPGPGRAAVEYGTELGPAPARRRMTTRMHPRPPWWGGNAA